MSTISPIPLDPIPSLAPAPAPTTPTVDSFNVRISGPNDRIIRMPITTRYASDWYRVIRSKLRSILKHIEIFLIPSFNDSTTSIRMCVSGDTTIEDIIPILNKSLAREGSIDKSNVFDLVVDRENNSFTLKLPVINTDKYVHIEMCIMHKKLCSSSLSIVSKGYDGYGTLLETFLKRLGFIVENGCVYENIYAEGEIIDRRLITEDVLTIESILEMNNYPSLYNVGSKISLFNSLSRCVTLSTTVMGLSPTGNQLIENADPKWVEFQNHIKVSNVFSKLPEVVAPNIIKRVNDSMDKLVGVKSKHTIINKYYVNKIVNGRLKEAREESKLSDTKFSKLVSKLTKSLGEPAFNILVMSSNPVTLFQKLNQVG